MAKKQEKDLEQAKSIILSGLRKQEEQEETSKKWGRDCSKCELFSYHACIKYCAREEEQEEKVKILTDTLISKNPNYEELMKQEGYEALGDKQIEEIKKDYFKELRLIEEVDYFIAKARNRYSKGSIAYKRGSKSLFITIPKDYRDLKGIKTGQYLKISIEVVK